MTDQSKPERLRETPSQKADRLRDLEVWMRVKYNLIVDEEIEIGDALLEYAALLERPPEASGVRLRLPVITVQMVADYGSDGFLEKTDKPTKGVPGVTWSQAAVDFAGLLQETAASIPHEPQEATFEEAFDEFENGGGPLDASRPHEPAPADASGCVTCGGTGNVTHGPQLVECGACKGTGRVPREPAPAEATGDHPRYSCFVAGCHGNHPSKRGVCGPHEPDGLRQELQNIANAKRWDRKAFDDDTAFADWAQSRARHALTKSGEPT